MRDLEKLAGITESEAHVLDESFEPAAFMASCARSRSRFAWRRAVRERADRRSHRCRKPNLLDQLCRVGVVHPEPGLLTEAPPRPGPVSAVAVTSANARYARDPGAALVSLDDDAVSAFAFTASTSPGLQLHAQKCKPN